MDRRIMVSRIKLIRKNPFFGYLALSLNIKEKKPEKMDMPTMGVDALGNMFYCKDFLDTLEQDEITFVIAHEVMHAALGHLLRLEGRDIKTWNIATDITVNNLLIDTLKESDEKYMKEPEGILKSDKYYGMSSEEIYEKLVKRQKNKNKKDGGKNKDYTGKRLDDHKHTDKNKLSGNQIRSIKREWKQKISAASQMAKSQGKLPGSLKRLVDSLIEEPKVNWKELLQKYVQREIPFDFSYSRPSKRSASVGTYMPHTVRESVDIVVGVDTSGSISDEDYKQFISEMIGIAHSHANVNMKVLFVDADVQNTVDIRTDHENTLMKMPREGYGGTDMRVIFKYINENIPNCRTVVILTDGFTPFPEYEEVNTIWTITSDGINENAFPEGVGTFVKM